MLEVLTDPDQFFGKKITDEISLKIPIAIIAVAGLVGAVNASIISQKLNLGGIPDVPEQMALFISIAGGISAFIGVFFMWVIYSGIFHLISSAFNGEGSFKRVLEFVAYGFIPTIAGSLISLAAAMTLPVFEFSVDNPELLQENIQQALLSNSAMQASNIIGIFLLLWSANIWIFALLHARSLTTRNALITVGIPIGLMVLFTVYNLAGVLL
ncbi:MAG: YIP1 family protein [Methanosarcinaceae archaeon]|nr:YIP1 family protein [Methanosarcinaceae archaeon]